jgi:NAD(P)-dependent dehydrogenase (short-subunit alcohol dehydrogenase family)
MTILISGASRGIGRAIALKLAAANHRLILVARTPNALDTLAKEIDTAGGDARAFPCDVTSPEDVVALHNTIISLYDGIDVLINNAGVAFSLKLEHTTDQIWRDTFAVNVDSAFYLTRTFLNQLKKSHSPRIINVASTAAAEGFAYTAAYTASKHALLGFSRATAKEFAKSKITVVTICPGFVRTSILEDGIKNIVAKTGKSAAEAEAGLAALNRTGKIIEPEEVADEVADAIELPHDPNGYEIVM